MIPPAARAVQREYDYIIVGAGSAGCVLANELSADPSKTVLLLEAGGWDTNPLIHIPAGVYSVFKDPSINWNMESEPEPACDGRRIELPRGKVCARRARRARRASRERRARCARRRDQ